MNRSFIIPLTLTMGVISCRGDKTQMRENTPNILWVTCEDITTMLGCYDDPNAHTPNLDAFADRSVRFLNAFSTATVSSPARSCIITGQYAVTLGTQHLRSWVNKPEEIVPFPVYLRRKGYYVTNNSKEDYNFSDSTIWDNSSHSAHWSGRGEKQPFFSVFNYEMTHQSAVFGSDSAYYERVKSYLPFIRECSPDSLILPPYYPDSKIIRKIWARYYTNVSIIDYKFNELIKELQSDGLFENTIVFFFSDHGTGMPRSKRALYDSGLKIPLLVHIPLQYQDRFNFIQGSTDDNIVSFIDFAPTILELAGIEVPEQMPGYTFISEEPAEKRQYAFGTSDRVDEAYEMSRSIRTKKYHYIRNFLPHLPLLQPNFYTDQSEIMQELFRMKDNFNLNPEQKAIFNSYRLPEELYYIPTDPHEIKNLATDQDYKKTLEEMRILLKNEMIRSFDTGLMPEPEMIKLSASDTPFNTGHNSQIFPIKEILDACDMALQDSVPDDTVVRYLKHTNGFVRYWALISAEKNILSVKELKAEVEKMTKDDLLTVQIEAAKCLIKAGESKYLQKISDLMNSNEDYLVLYAARAYQEISHLVNETPPGILKKYKTLQTETKQGKDWSDYYKIYTYWSLSTALEK